MEKLEVVDAKRLVDGVWNVLEYRGKLVKEHLEFSERTGLGDFEKGRLIAYSDCQALLLFWFKKLLKEQRLTPLLYKRGGTK